jgi:AbrB family looped-hinge helix DNA binding protein
MMTTKLSEKGQIVIPVELRKRYDISPGDKVELIDIGGEIVIVPITAKDPVEAAKGLLRSGRTTRELLRRARREEQAFARRKR